MKPFLRDNTSNLELQCLQLIANICVQNRKTQEKVWSLFDTFIMQILKDGDFKLVNVASMIIFNMLLCDSEVDENEVFQILIEHIEKHLKNTEDPLPEYLGFLLDHLICDHPRIVEIYQNLSQDQQLIVLYYVLDHIKDEENQ